MSKKDASRAQEGRLSNYPDKWVKTTGLEDGTLVTIRPIRSDDAPRLQVTFARFSPESIYMRFLESVKELTDEQARYFTNVDYYHRMAFVGTIQDNGGEQVIGVSRYEILGTDQPGLAESAIIIQDDYQGIGLGKLLMKNLVEYARAQGVTAFLGTIQMGNMRILSLIEHGGLVHERKLREPGVWEVKVFLG